MPEGPPLLTVVVPTYRRPRELERCLQALLDADDAEPWEIVVTDDGHDAEDLVHRLSMLAVVPIRYLPGPRLGPAANRNQAAAAAAGSWLLFTDDDCIPDRSWVASMRRAVSTGDVDVVEGRTQAGHVRTRLDQVAPVNESGGYWWSCNLAVRRDAFDQWGGFSSQFPGAALEDVEFRIRSRAHGAREIFAPDALVIHPWRAGSALSELRRTLTGLDILRKLQPAFAAHIGRMYYLRSAYHGLSRDLLVNGPSVRFRGSRYVLTMVILHLWLALVGPSRRFLGGNRST